MTITINDTFTEVTITSSILTETNASVKLTVSYNCTTEYDELSFDSDVDPLIVTAEDLGLESFVDGVWGFKLVVVDESDNTLTELKCKFFNQNSSCLMLETYKDIENEDSLIKVLSFEALLIADQCNSCSCDDMCDLYNSTGLNPNSNVTNCGCT